MFSRFFLLFPLLFFSCLALLHAEEEPAYSYLPDGKRDPFQLPPELVPSNSSAAGEETENRQPKRQKEFLESFQLDSLKLVATLFQIHGEQPAAMVEDSSGMGHMVRPGQYIGVNEGRIIQIGDGEMLIEEPMSGGSNTLKTRTITLKLPREEGE